MSEVVTLTVRGVTYEGWKEIRISRSIKAIAASFTLSLTDRWTENAKPWILVPGDECEVKANGQTVVKGYIDDLEASYDSQSRTITVTGREVTGDLVDCSVEYTTQTELPSISVFALAKKLASPFGIKVRNDSGVNRVIEKASVNIGDTPHQVLDRYARQCGLLLTSDGKGTLVIQKVGQSSASAQLIEGENILSASSSYSMKDRFSEYRVVGQNTSVDGDVVMNSASKGKATDSEVTRKRLLVVQAETATTPELCQARAKWEKFHRIGGSVKVNVKVQGWRLSDGKLFEPNRLYKISSPWIGVAEELLLEDMALTISENGTIAELSFTRPDAYQPEGASALGKKSQFAFWKNLVKENQKSGISTGGSTIIAGR